MSYPVFHINTQIQVPEFIKVKTYKKKKDASYVPPSWNKEENPVSNNEDDVSHDEGELPTEIPNPINNVLTYNFITNMLHLEKKPQNSNETSDSDNEIAQIHPSDISSSPDPESLLELDPETPPDQNLELESINIKMYRSVLTDENNEILCFSPPSAFPLEEFKKKNPVISSNIYANEIIEGTMINIFYDKRLEAWEISTRATVGGNYWYYRNQYSSNENATQLTFRQMFMECMGYYKDDDLSCVELFKIFPTNFCYSFVMQHPANHMVLNITTPTLYLVSVYELNKTSVTYIPPPVYESWEIFSHPNTHIQFPQKYNLYSYEEYESQYASLYTTHHILGVMFTDLLTGERSSMTNVVYESVRKLRGNNPNLQYQFFALKDLDEKQKFLKYFPMYTDQFFEFSQEYQKFIGIVHQYYFEYYILKQPSITPIPKKYFIHVSRIHHNIYLPSLESGRIVITHKVVESYFNSMSSGELMHYMYYKDKPKKIMEQASV
jgi:hypothetical protein